MPSSDRSPVAGPVRRFLVCAAAALIGSALSLALHSANLKHWLHYEQSWADAETPLLTTWDGYYYLRLAEELREDRYAPQDDYRAGHRPVPAPLLSRTAAVLADLTGQPLTMVAFVLPCLLAALLPWTVAAWAAELGGVRLAWLASLAVPTSLFWMERTVLGSFDTDCLIPVLLTLELFCAYRFHVRQGAARWLWLAAALASAGLLGWWWTSVPFAGLAALAGVLGLSVILPSGRTERAVKIALILGGLLFLLTPQLGLDTLLPDPAGHLVRSVQSHLELLFKTQQDLLPEAGAFIEENVSGGLLTTVVKAGGSLAGFVLGLAGLLFLARERFAAFVFLTPILALGLGSFFSLRLAEFWAPLHGLGVAWAVGMALDRTPRLAPAWAGPARLALLGLCAALLLRGVNPLFRDLNLPQITRPDQQLAATLTVLPPDRIAWSWWDYGYFLQYFGKTRTLVDNGFQSSLHLYVAAYPLTASSPELAANWMRFFAAHGVEALPDLADRLGGLDRAVAFLADVFSRPDHAASRLAAAGLDEAEWTARLFPEREVFLWLTTRMLEFISVIHDYGSYDFAARTSPPFSVLKLPLRGTTFEPDKNLLRQAGSEQAYQVERFIDLGPDAKKYAYPSGSGILIKAPNRSAFYVLPSSFKNSLYCRLIFDDPTGLAGFTPLTYQPAVGGVWRIAPR